MTFPGTPLIDVAITPEAITGITVTAVGITQLVKWAGVGSEHAPRVLAGVSLGIVLMWVFTPSAYKVLVAAVLVMMGASGVYGFSTRQTPKDTPPTDTPVTTKPTEDTPMGDAKPPSSAPPMTQEDH